MANAEDWTILLAANAIAPTPIKRTRKERTIRDIRLSPQRKRPNPPDCWRVAGQIEHVETTAKHSRGRSFTKPGVRVRLIEEHPQEKIGAHDHDVSGRFGWYHLTARVAGAAI